MRGEKGVGRYLGEGRDIGDGRVGGWCRERYW